MGNKDWLQSVAPVLEEYLHFPPPLKSKCLILVGFVLYRIIPLSSQNVFLIHNRIIWFHMERKVKI